MTTTLHQKRGAALVIVLGFLAILTITIIAFTTQTRSERLAARAYTSTAQTRHLLGTALTRAMVDIDTRVNGGIYPSFFALSFQDGDEALVADSVNFDLEENYFAIGNEQISAAYLAELDSARWQTVTDSNMKPVGRVGYIVINSSGLLDANAVGGITGSRDSIERRAGVSPKELQLSNNRRIIDEFNASASSFNHIDAEHPGGVKRSAATPDLSPAVAFAYNREHAWRRFETLRDLYELNQIKSRVFTTEIESFSTFSYDPEIDDRTFMGTNSATLNESFIREELETISSVQTNADFVMNQLRDYLDTDTFPEDENGAYTDLSVEPVPLINELILTCDFAFFPQLEEVEDEEGKTTMEVTSVIISNRYDLELEVWYPFVGYTNENRFSVVLNITPEQSKELPVDLFADLAEWIGNFEIPVDTTTPGSAPHTISIHSADRETEVSDANEMVELFEDMQSDIQFPALICTDDSGNKVDQVLRLELPMETAVGEKLLPLIEELSTNLFSLAATDTSSRFVVGMACVDPRLNWNGESKEQWVEDAASGENIETGSLGKINTSIINDHTETPDNTDKIFVRNTDRIDTPYEFTYFLYDPTKPWKTFQMLEDNDDDGTRYILRNLSPHPNGPPKHGRINPYSPHTNVMASIFMSMPINEFDTHGIKRLSAKESVEAAELLMGHIAKNGWSIDSFRYGSGIDTDALKALVGDENPWGMESFFRNTYELFNPRDTLYTILLVAQNGTDIDKDGIISDDEVRGSQQAIVYIWRDPDTEKAVCVFYGLSDTLQSSISGAKWSEILDNFRPNP